MRTYGALGPGDARLHRVEDAAAEVVPQAAEARDLGREAGDDGDGRVLVEVVHDDELVGRRHAGGQGAEDGLDGLALVVDGQDDRELGRVRSVTARAIGPRLPGADQPLGARAPASRPRARASDRRSGCEPPAPGRLVRSVRVGAGRRALLVAGRARQRRVGRVLGPRHARVVLVDLAGLAELLARACGSAARLGSGAACAATRGAGSAFGSASPSLPVASACRSPAAPSGSPVEPTAARPRPRRGSRG